MKDQYDWVKDYLANTGLLFLYLFMLSFLVLDYEPGSSNPAENPWIFVKIIAYHQFLLTLFFTRLYPKLQSRLKLGDEPILSFPVMSWLFRSREHGILTLLLGLIFAGTFYTMPLKVAVTLFAFNYLQMVLTYLLVLIVPNQKWFNIGQQTIIVLLCLSILGGRFLPMEVPLTLNPITLFLTAPLWIFKVNALTAIFGALLLFL